jgi:hypothetical protein
MYRRGKKRLHASRTINNYLSVEIEDVNPFLWNPHLISQEKNKGTVLYLKIDGSAGGVVWSTTLIWDKTGREGIKSTSTRPQEAGGVFKPGERSHGGATGREASFPCIKMGKSACTVCSHSADRWSGSQTAGRSAIQHPDLWWWWWW